MRGNVWAFIGQKLSTAVSFYWTKFPIYESSLRSVTLTNMATQPQSKPRVQKSVAHDDTNESSQSKHRAKKTVVSDNTDEAQHEKPRKRKSETCDGLDESPPKKARTTKKNITSDNDEINQLVGELVMLQDITASGNGESSKSQDKSAIKQFIQFMKTHVKTNVQPLSDIPVDQVTKETIGQFCTYMLQNEAIGYQTTMNYFSSIRRQLEKSHSTQIFKADPEWYKECRRRLTRSYVLSCLRGTP